MHHALGFGLFAFLLVFVFGKEAARVIIGGGMLVCVLTFMYVAVRIIMGTI